MDYRPYFEGVESIMEPLGGRPHWGKLHFRTAETLKPQYPKWSSFQKIRNTLDPDGRFANAYVGRVMDGSTP
jgi:L-gulonolactone oxidase